MKAIWSGSISFGLVSIPIKLYSAVETKTLGFKMLCKKCKTPVHYKRYCEGCKQELSMSDIVKGLEISKGEYLIFTDEELEKIKPAKSDQIVIREFVDIDEIAPIYYNKFYYCAPAKAKERAFFLFNEVLKTSGKVAIGRFVMRDKEYVCAIESYKSGLLLTTLNYKYEIRDINDIKELKETPELNKQEIELAAKLVDQLYEEKFDLSEFKDTFAEQLKDLLKNKDRVEIKDKKEKRVTEKPLIEALKASLK
jgi:DNA end-binding protein Ku